MSMIPVPENPDFSTDMTALEVTTPAYAPTFNNMFEQLLENDAHLKKEIDDHSGIGLDTEENIKELARKLMEEGGVDPEPVPPGDEVATDEEVEEAISQLDDL